jgi:hypothetical protein
MDPLSISTLGAESLKLGIQFLYNQAGEILKRRRELEDDGAATSVPTAPGASLILARDTSPLVVDVAALGRIGPQIEQLWSALGVYAGEIRSIDPDDPHLAELAESLRRCLEAVLGQDLTFSGEHDRQRLDIGVRVQVEDVAGYVAGVLARGGADGQIRAEVKARNVLRGGRLVGVESREEPRPKDDH